MNINNFPYFKQNERLYINYEFNDNNFEYLMQVLRPYYCKGYYEKYYTQLKEYVCSTINESGKNCFMYMDKDGELNFNIKVKINVLSNNIKFFCLDECKKDGLKRLLLYGKISPSYKPKKIDYEV
jgi:hypothetical protein